jgi:hypothetical protein
MEKDHIISQFKEKDKLFMPEVNKVQALWKKFCTIQLLLHHVYFHFRQSYRERITTHIRLKPFNTIVSGKLLVYLIALHVLSLRSSTIKENILKLPTHRKLLRNQQKIPCSNLLNLLFRQNECRHHTDVLQHFNLLFRQNECRHHTDVLQHLMSHFLQHLMSHF